jgi:hypothetical protein
VVRSSIEDLFSDLRVRTTLHFQQRF